MISRTPTASVAAAIAIHDYRYSNEDDLQAGLAAALTAVGYTVEREVRLSPVDRIDLVVDRVGVEVKVAAAGRVTPTDRVLTQLARYAASGRVDALLLVTTSHRHTTLPDRVGGVPLTVHVVGRFSA